MAEKVCLSHKKVTATYVK